MLYPLILKPEQGTSTQKVIKIFLKQAPATFSIATINRKFYFMGQECGDTSGL